MPIQFGLSPAMSTHGGSSSKPSSNSKGQCRECVRLDRKGHRNARDPKFCERHQCPSTDPAGITCTIRKKSDDVRCQSHTRCKVRDCRDPRAGVLNDYCEKHTCVAEDCHEGRVHDPDRRVYDDLCATHLSKICKVPTCVYRQSENGSYCVQHTCLENCNEKNLVSEGGRPFCTEHNKCFMEGCQKPRCQFEDGFEDVCREHYVPPCRIETCNLQSSPATRYCDLHSCRYASHERCKKEARPGRGKPFCVDHKCSDVDCQLLRTFSEIEGALRMNSFCPEHECRDKACLKHTIQDKLFCNSHCCTDPGCTEAREGNPRFGTLCLTHHEEKIVNERLAEIRVREERQAANDRAEQARRLREQQTASARAEQARRQAPRREEDRRDRRQPYADAERRPEPPRRPTPPRQQYGGQEGLRPRRERFDNEYTDEGYRSNRSSGESFGEYGHH